MTLPCRYEVCRLAALATINQCSSVFNLLFVHNWRRIGRIPSGRRAPQSDRTRVSAGRTATKNDSGPPQGAPAREEKTMKVRLTSAALVGSLVAAPAFATDFCGTCQSCCGGGSASWLAARRRRGAGERRGRGRRAAAVQGFSGRFVGGPRYSVDSAPVVDSGDTTPVDTDGFEGLTCADLGF
ncbi:hypothetical protein [Tahibacter caeni]|uniref:hypothetical protein n=1 Tax=Tahibacter caeni TaxID=1453545 RepID=UPI0021483DF2|nr:hypothetical protein [Tahibacter caeni]